MRPTAILGIFRPWRYRGYWRALRVRTLYPWWLRRLGVDVGPNVTILGLPIVSMAPGSIIRLGPGCILCSWSSDTALGVSHPVVLRTLRTGATVDLGANVQMSGGAICSATSVHIGEGTLLGADATIVDTDFHSLNALSRTATDPLDGASSKRVSVGRGVFVGTGALVLKGVVIGDGAVIAARAVVTREVNAREIVGGSPAVKLGEFPLG